MPTYQYACTACGHQLEAVQSFTDEPLTECPACEGRLRKLFSSVGIVFKGSGFYRTDSRAGNGSTKDAGDSGKSGSDSSTTTGTNGAKKEPATAGAAAPAKSTSSGEAA